MLLSTQTQMFFFICFTIITIVMLACRHTREIHIRKGHISIDLIDDQII